MSFLAMFSTTAMVQGLMPYDDAVKGTPSVTPAKAGVQDVFKSLDSGFRRNDGFLGIGFLAK